MKNVLYHMNWFFSDKMILQAKLYLLCLIFIVIIPGNCLKLQNSNIFYKMVLYAIFWYMNTPQQVTYKAYVSHYACCIYQNTEILIIWVDKIGFQGFNYRLIQHSFLIFNLSFSSVKSNKPTDKISQFNSIGIKGL